MNTACRLISAFLITVVLSLGTLAGDMATPKPSTPPALTGDIETPKAHTLQTYPNAYPPSFGEDVVFEFVLQLVMPY